MKRGGHWTGGSRPCGRPANRSLYLIHTNKPSNPISMRVSSVFRGQKMKDDVSKENQPSGDAVDMLENDFDAFFEFLTEGAQDGEKSTA